MKKLSLGKNCTACGKERKTKALGYHPATLEAFCDNPYVCNEDHPNSAQNLIRTQKQTQLVTFAEANEAHKDQLLANFDEGTVAKIQKMLTKPITIRIHSPEMAEFIVSFQEESNHENVSEVIWYAIEMLMQNKGAYLKDHMKRTVEKKIETAANEAVAPFAEISGVHPALTESAPKQKQVEEEELSF